MSGGRKRGKRNREERGREKEREGGEGREKKRASNNLIEAKFFPSTEMLLFHQAMYANNIKMNAINDGFT